MLNFISRFFDSNEKELKKIQPLIVEINALEENVKKLKDQQFPKKTQEMKECVESGESLELILPEAFALVREAARRTIDQRHYDVQLMAAVALSSGKVAEQKTGEGKTLSAVPALYLNSLTGKSVHLVTVNDYLARRDAGWMGPIFHLLGLSVSSMISEQSFLYDPSFTNQQALDFRLLHLKPVTRKEAYHADIVYGINSEFGFDYLRDNMAKSLDEVVQRGHYYAVVDEVDSVLIDEARTPHIISAPDTEPTEKYYEYARLVDKLQKDTDYKIDEKLRTAHLTDHGISKIEKMYGIENIYEKNFDTVYHLQAALKARTLFHKEKDYIVRDGEVILVDEFTGRLMIGRRLSEGLHQAIEAKEGVTIQRESKTLATVSLQNYFRMYEKLAGMTGTAVTEAEEFKKIYNLDVVVVPTNKTMIRADSPDAIYKTNRAKLTAVAKQIAEIHKTGQPILVGTTAIDKNEIISELLKRKGIKHEILNAKNHEREAEIIARAGEKDAVTVATNMAGRGVDIILGGESPKSEDGSAKQNSSEWKEWERSHDEVVRSGGLYVIGTERHESRRIDNQLRGRSGRQGDPGASIFFVGLDDEIMRLFGGDKIAGLMTRFNMPEDIPLQHPLVSRAIEQAQVKVEGFNFDIRKHLVEYDDVLNKQREIIYKLRRKVLEGDVSKVSKVPPLHQGLVGQPKASRGKEKEAFDTFDTSKPFGTFSLKGDILEKIRAFVTTLVMMREQIEVPQEGKTPSESIIEEFSTMIPFDDNSKKQLVTQIEQRIEIDEKIDFLYRLAEDVYNQREKQFGEPLMREVEKFVELSVIDSLWMDHLDAIDHLREGVRLRAYGQKDPLVEYKNEAFRMFEQLVSSIDDQIVQRIYKIHVHQQPPTEQMPKNIVTNTPESEVSVAKQKPINNQQNAKKKLGRNDPCWCGAIDPHTGKPYKYKKCGLIDAPYHRG